MGASRDPVRRLGLVGSDDDARHTGRGERLGRTMRRPLRALAGVGGRVQTTQQHRESGGDGQYAATAGVRLVKPAWHGQRARVSVSCFRDVARCCNWGLLA